MAEQLMRRMLEAGYAGAGSKGALWSRIALQDMSYVFDQLLYEGSIQPGDADALEVEFKRFFFLVSTRRQPLAMIGPLVDRVWHQFVLFTEKYSEFCRRTAGFFVHHRPDTATTPVPVEAGENFLRAYEDEFGSLPALWWKGMSPETEAFYKLRPLRGRPPVRWSGWTGEIAPAISRSR